MHALAFLRALRGCSRPSVCAACPRRYDDAALLARNRPHGAQDAAVGADIDNGREGLYVRVSAFGGTAALGRAARAGQLVGVAGEALGAGVGGEGGELAAAQDRFEGQLDEELGGGREEGAEGVGGGGEDGVDARGGAEDQRSGCGEERWECGVEERYWEEGRRYCQGGEMAQIRKNGAWSEC